MDFTGIFNTVWGWIVASLGGVSLAGILAAIIYGCLKGAFNKAIAKINVEEVAKDVSRETMEQTVAQVKGLSFKQSLQPIVETQLKKITLEAQELVKKELEEVKEKYDKLLLVLEALSKYFDNSIGVSEEAKSALKDAIEVAKEESVEEHTESEVVVESVDVEEKPTEETKKSTRVER